MQLKLTTDYAIRIALYLSKENSIRTSKEIAEYTQISPNYVLKVLRALTKVKIVRNHIGVYGGFTLGKSPKDISMLDIIRATESTVKISYCLEHDIDDSTGGYETIHSVYNFYSNLQSELEGRLAAQTLEDLLT